MEAGEIHVKFSIKDTNNSDQILKKIKALQSTTINVGILSDESEELKMIASVHEFGCDIQVTNKMRGWFGANGYPLRKETTVIRIPERSFLRSGYDENIQDIANEIEQQLPNVFLNDVDPAMFMDHIGMKFAGMIKKKIRDIKSPANSDMTIERKGSSNPLVDSGNLLSSVRHEVKK